MTKINDGGPLANAIEHLRNFLPAHDAVWTGQDIANGTADAEPIDIDYDIATILNAVMSGELVPAIDNAALPAGMSLWEYMAAHAPITLDDAIDLCGFNRSHHPLGNDADRIIILKVLVRARLEYADAMLAAFLAARSGGQDDE